MFTLTLSSVALLSSSTVSASAIPMDSNLAALSLAQNAVEQEIVSDNKAVKNNLNAVVDSCKGNVECIRAGTITAEPQVINGWFAEQDGYSALQPVIALALIIAVLVVFLARKSISTK